MNKIPLLGLDLDALTAVAIEVGLPKFTGKQLADWIYKKRGTSIEQMSNISLKGRQALSEKYIVGRYEPALATLSDDETKKYLFRTEKGNIETVYIPDKERATLCISCQIGCKMSCQFCMTGKQGWSGNLSATDILNQILSVEEAEKITNIVYMGMGEPMDNIDAILQSLSALTSAWGMGMSPHRITVSTVGLIPNMIKFIEQSEAHLAISLHNPNHEERVNIMPAEKAFPIADVVKELKKYDWSHQRRVSFEYILFEGMNDSPRHITQLVRLLKGLQCRINLIRFHAVPGVPFHSPKEEEIIRFRDALTANGITTTIRRSRGEDIKAACGLLSSNYNK